MQSVTRIELTKKSETFGVSDRLLFGCSTSVGAVCTINDNRVSLARGDTSGLQFVFTLSSTNHSSDSGLYEVTVQGTHPGSGTTLLKKEFRLQVDPGETC